MGTAVRARWLMVTGALFLLTLSAARAADIQACSEPEFRQFDFRLGSFGVTTRLGQPAGSALVESVLGGCMLVEYWTGAISGQGRAHYFYDRNDRLWHLVFINDEGGRLTMAGSLQEGAMVFKGLNRFGSFEGLQRMTWALLSDGRISQHWELSSDNGGTWTSVVLGYYAQRPAVPR